MAIEERNPEVCDRCSSDADRPLKHFPIMFWFDNPAFCITPPITEVPPTPRHFPPSFPAELDQI